MSNHAEDYDHLFIKGNHLHFQDLNNVFVFKRDLELFHISGSAIVTGRFQNVSFYNASFLSTKLSEVDFIDCDLKTSDITSFWAKGCKFQKVDFSNSTISDSTYINCSFQGCSFRSTSLTKCQFINCIFDQFPIDDSTFSLNTFKNCEIRNTHFTESFFYQIFDNCTFDHVNMSPSLFGYNFGFSSATLQQLSSGVRFEDVEQEFMDRGLYINAALLKINQVHNLYDEALIACLVAVGQMIEHDILVKNDEIDFIRELTVFLQGKGQIAPITILRIWQILSGYIQSNQSNIASQKAKPHFQEFANTLYIDFLNFQKELHDIITRFPTPSSPYETAELEIVYVKRPSSPLLNCLTELSTLADPNSPKPRLIREEIGSFHEFHEIAMIVMPYLQTLFAFLGAAVPIAIYKLEKKKANKTQSNNNDLSSERQTNDEDKPVPKELSTQDEKPILEITLIPTTSKKTPLLLPGNEYGSQNTNQIVIDVAKVLASQPFYNQKGFCGYNGQNIEKIIVRYD